MEKVKGKPESRDAAIRRLALRARELGVKVYCHDLGKTVEYFATSTSRPGTLHRVTVLSCDCEGFLRYQRCTHHSALLESIGELPPAPTPDPADVAALLAARVELARLEDLNNRHLLKTTADIRNLQTARGRVAELLPFIPDTYRDQPVASYAAD